MNLSQVTLGIRPKLLFAFGCVLATTLAASAIALLSFSRFADSLGAITKTSVPLMAESMELSQQAVEVEALVPLMTHSPTVEEAAQHRDEIFASFANARELIEKQIEQGIGIDEHESQLKEFEKNKVRTNEIHNLTVQRIEVSERFAELSEQVSDELSSVDQTLLDIIDTSTFEFVVAADEKTESTGMSLNTLLNTSVEPMVSGMKLGTELFKLNRLMAASLSGETDSLVKDSRQAKRLAGKMRRLRAKIDPDTIKNKDEYERLLDRTVELAVSDNSIYKMPIQDMSSFQIDAIVNEIEAIEMRFPVVVAPMVDSSLFDTFKQVEELTGVLDKDLPELLSDGVEQLVTLLQLRIELNTMAGVVALMGGVTNETLLDELQQRYTRSQAAITEASSNVGTVQGLDSVLEEIAKVNGMTSSKAGLFNLRSQFLALSGQIEQLEHSLSEDQSKTVTLLASRVADSRNEVDQAELVVRSGIGNSRLQLLAVAASSVLMTVLVFWFLVSKDILARLLHTITALRTLADGNYEVKVNSQGGDELADLARTVDVFRQNGLEALNLQKEQEELTQQNRKKELQQLEVERQAQGERDARHKQEQLEANEKQEQARLLQDRVDELLVAVSAAAKGNLSHPIDTAGDDLAGQMGRALSTLFSELRASMKGIDDNAAQVARASESLNTLSVDMNTMASANTASAQQASELTTEVGSTVDSVAGATEQMSSSIREIARNTTEAEVVAGKAVALAGSTDATVRKLAESSAGIGSVIKVITSIAEQTNLLALNATIEAARAGDAGKGFAVVANEVKELAKETARATDQIESKIGDIQTDTESAVDAIQSISEIIESISSIQSTIAVAVDQQSSVTDEISRSIVQTASSSESISTVIQSVAEKAVITQDASDEISNASLELSDTAVQLQQLVRRFTAG